MNYLIVDGKLQFSFLDGDKPMEELTCVFLQQYRGSYITRDYSEQKIDVTVKSPIQVMTELA